MDGSYLDSIAKNIDLESIPLQWKNIDFVKFSENKSLYPYQREALENTLKILYRYFFDFNKKDTKSLKETFLRISKQNNLTSEQLKENFAYTEPSSKAYEILVDYFESEYRVLPAYNFINRMCFWMATGSGKSIVLIKLIELLHDLMKGGLIPKNDILFLTHRLDLIDQLKAHINEFNTYARKERNIELVVRDLKELPDRKIANESFKDYYIDIYYYRSDLISDVQKENIINFKNYDNEGNWYIILDEAHKGDSDESKRKQYYNILCRNGFLFNFSATFTDEIDVLSTVYNINLSEYIKKGFGKHLFVLQEQFKNFQTYQVQEGRKLVLDFVEEEKQKIVLMSLILLTFIKKIFKEISSKNASYHNPLLLTLVNSVSAEDSDLYLFFKELQKIAKKELNNEIFEKAKFTLTSEFYNNSLVEFEKVTVLSNEEIEEIKNITIDEVLYYVFNSATSGEFEVRRNPRNKQELSFRVKSAFASEPFALIKIGDVKEFEKNNLAKYDIEEEFENISLFENIDSSSVNILMGSRAFYEGWDSNRPNIINFVNIGTQKEAKKFILQSIGRGIRIEPIKNHRKRFEPLINDRVIEDDTLKLLAKKVKPIETLFIFGTNKNAILSVLEHLKSEQLEEEYQIDLFENQAQGKELYIPKYRQIQSTEQRDRKMLKLKIHKDDYLVCKDLVNTIDKRVLLLNFNLNYFEVNLLTEKLKNENNFELSEEGKIGRIEPLIKHILNYYRIPPEEVEDFTLLKDEICHHNHIKVRTSLKGTETSIEFSRFEELKKKIEKAKKPVDFEAEEAKLMEKYKDDIKKFAVEHKNLINNTSLGEEKFVYRNERIKIKKLMNHYYFPSIISESERIVWMKHIIDTPSELKFINALEKELKKGDNFFTKFDWWLFSKIDHTLDKNIRIPYIDPSIGKRNFLPDFVFWLQKGDDYHILYVDPKGAGRREYQYKVDGYRSLFVENEIVKSFKLNKKNFYVHLSFVTEDTNIFTEYDFYKKYWVDVNDMNFGF